MKAFFFDLDNTLVKFESGFAFWEPHFRQTLRRYGIETDEREATEILASGLINRRLEEKGLNIHKFWASFNLIDYEARRAGLAEGKIRLYEDALPLLESLKHEYLAIVSNTHLSCVRMEMEHLGLMPYFAKVSAYTGVEHPKPHPQLALMAADGKNFREVFVVGDARADMLCGKAIGAKTIYVDRLNEDVEADYTVKNLSEIRKVV